MQKTTERFMLAIIIAITLIVTAIPVFASNDDIPYEFHLKTGYVNSYSAERYRQTTNLDNKWKVNMTYSEEGMGSIATYWIVRASDKVLASDTHNVATGSGNHYYSALSTGSQENVRLTAENNTNTSTIITVTGFWDEETD